MQTSWKLKNEVYFWQFIFYKRKIKTYDKSSFNRD
jgi:hypothetical protein